MLYDRPGGSCRPRETLVPSRVQRVVRILCGYRRDGDASPLVAHGLGDSVSVLIKMAQGRCPNHSGGFAPVRFPGSPPLAQPLSETQVHLEGLLVSQHVVAGSRKLVRQSLDRQDAVRLALLAFIKTLGLR